MPKKGSSNLERRFDRRSLEVPKRKTQCSVDVTEGRHSMVEKLVSGTNMVMPLILEVLRVQVGLTLVFIKMNWSMKTI